MPTGFWATQPETVLLRELQTAMSEAELAIARRMEMGSTDLAAMSHLSFADEPVGPGWLAGRLGLTPGAVTELVDRLERAGHLDRRRDTADRRRVQLVPTDSALGEVAGRLRPLLAALDALSQGYSEADRETIQGYLAAVTAAYAEFAEPTHPG